MDPFENIPEELRFEIFSHMDQTGAKSLSYASPTMYRELGRSAGLLKKHFRISVIDLEDDLLQDAMAILLFPERTEEFRGQDVQWKEVVDAHLERWRLKQFPHPLKEENPEMINTLSSLVNRIHLFMEDYVSKATSSRLAQAHFCLPRWANPSLSEGVTYDGPLASPRLVRLWSLTAEEFKRLMQAFLRYELLCKVYHPRPSGSIPGTEEYGVFWDLNRWYWTLLRRRENRDTELCDPKILDGKYELCGSHVYRDFDMLQCVFEYVRTLHGALATRVRLHYWHLPAGIGPRFHESPEDSFFNDYWAVRYSIYLRHDFIYDTALVACGLDLIAQLLSSSDKSQCERFYNRFFEEVRPSTIDLRPIRPPSWMRPEEGSNSETRSWMGTADPTRQKLLPEQEDHLRLYRQRAWALFDNGRLYPKTCDLSAYPGYPAREKAFLRQYDRLGLIKYDPEMHRPYRGEDIRGPVVMASRDPQFECHSLRGWGQTPFWDERYNS